MYIMLLFAYIVKDAEEHIVKFVKRLGVLFGLLAIYAAAAGKNPTFWHDVAPILQNRCQECHRANQMAPMPLVTYAQTRPWAKAIREVVNTRKMPPWFADPCCGHFANDRSLTAVEIETLTRWVDSGTEEGSKADASPVKVWTDGWNLTPRDAEISMPKPFSLPVSGEIEYQYFVVPTGFKVDQWIQGVEVRPGNRAVVHHIVVYIREAGSTWTHGPTKADILAVYAPGSSPQVWPEGMAKLVKTGSDLVFEIHYTPDGKPGTDRTSIALQFAKSAPSKRVLTLQLNNDHFLIPAGDSNYRVSAWGSLPNDALLLGFFPHMHLRGKAFEYDLILADGRVEPLMRVSHYDFYWQLFYELKTPIPLKKGARIACYGIFDNSVNNSRNPDASVDVKYGQQSREEMMIGFFDVAVDAAIGKPEFFVR